MPRECRPGRRAAEAERRKHRNRDELVDPHVTRRRRKRTPKPQAGDQQEMRLPAASAVPSQRRLPLLRLHPSPRWQQRSQETARDDLGMQGAHPVEALLHDVREAQLKRGPWPRSSQQGVQLRTDERQDRDADRAKARQQGGGLDRTGQPTWRRGMTSIPAAPIATSASASTTRSTAAVATTKANPSPVRELTMAVRISSPARAGRKLFPEYPTAVAENASAWLIEPAAVSRSRQRHARRKRAIEPSTRARPRRTVEAPATISRSAFQSIPRME